MRFFLFIFLGYLFYNCATASYYGRGSSGGSNPQHDLQVLIQQVKDRVQSEKLHGRRAIDLETAKDLCILPSDREGFIKKCALLADNGNEHHFKDQILAERFCIHLSGEVARCQCATLPRSNNQCQAFLVRALELAEIAAGGGGWKPW